jgi:hypothetical protein
LDAIARLHNPVPLLYQAPNDHLPYVVPILYNENGRGLRSLVCQRRVRKRVRRPYYGKVRARGQVRRGRADMYAVGP